MSDWELHGDDISNYTIKHQIGSGAFGNVYKATDNQAGCDVALKVSFWLIIAKRSKLINFLHHLKTEYIILRLIICIKLIK